MIGFVGLIVPHCVRLMTGPDHRRLFPASALAGALMLVVLDALARTVAAPREIPVGVLAALCGTPFSFICSSERKGKCFEDRRDERFPMPMQASRPARCLVLDC